jgi:hypothetical protein
MLGIHPGFVKVMAYIPLPCPLLVVPLKARVKGDTMFSGYSGETELSCALPWQVNEIDDPSIVMEQSL